MFSPIHHLSNSSMKSKIQVIINWRCSKNYSILLYSIKRPLFDFHCGLLVLQDYHGTVAMLSYIYFFSFFAFSFNLSYFKSPKRNASNHFSFFVVLNLLLRKREHVFEKTTIRIFNLKDVRWSL